ncbi:hypothetical protein [uncultured Hymenobacter sp.]|uniref:hypothetical protein n=1 Tax=uncultured Hymenobacter sp. TaxID=170016 RepID=UPI0035CAD23A
MMPILACLISLLLSYGLMRSADFVVREWAAPAAHAASRPTPTALDRPTGCRQDGRTVPTPSFPSKRRERRPTGRPRTVGPDRLAGLIR